MANRKAPRAKEVKQPRKSGAFLHGLNSLCEIVLILPLAIIALVYLWLDQLTSPED
jgi:hypothetical protein